MPVSIEILEERISALKEDIKEFKLSEAEQGRRLNEIIKQLFGKSEYNLKAINEVSSKIDRVESRLRDALSKLNMKIILISSGVGIGVGGGSSLITKLLGS